jgi:hypothetical protein
LKIINIIMHTFLKLSDIIGCKIEAIRCHYTKENEYGQQMFFSYLKLSIGDIIGFPMFDEENFMELSESNIQYFQNQFATGYEFSNSKEDLIIGKTIKDIYFCYFDNKIVGDERAYIQLDNEKYLTEINFGPLGIGIGLSILNEQDFKENIKQNGQEVKSYLELKAI